MFGSEQKKHSNLYWPKTLSGIGLAYSSLRHHKLYTNYCFNLELSRSKLEELNHKPDKMVAYPTPNIIKSRWISLYAWENFKPNHTFPPARNYHNYLMDVSRKACKSACKSAGALSLCCYMLWSR